MKERQVNISVAGLLLPGMFLVMFGLKLAGVINISWWLVTMPLWGPVAVVAAIVATVCAVLAIGTGVQQVARLLK